LAVETVTAKSELDVRLDAPLPESLTVGRGTALFVAGTCFAPSEAVGSLALLVDGAEQPLMAFGMPRLDVLEASGEPAGHRAGFWGMARIGPRSPGTLEVGLRARLRDGDERSAELARIAVAEAPPPPPGTPLVAIAMATFEPPVELFRRQVESIRAQTLADWVCVISDDCSTPARFAELKRVVADDPRFVVSRSDRRRGFYGNFGRALELVPAGARYVALADQDDVWDPDKLETLVAEIGDAQLVYSDQRIISAAGERLAETYWSARANEHEDMLALLVANCVTGAASLFRRELLDVALPLPPAQFTHYHDHWIALNALALGDIRFVDRPLYDYVQHHGATLGHATATRMVRLRDRLSSLRRGLRERVRLWRAHYFLDACRTLHFATVLELRCGDRMSAGKRRALARLMRADRSALAIPVLFARGARELVRPRPQTLGAEWMLGYAFTWRRLLAASAPRLDALPPVLHPRPRVRVPGDPDLRVLAEGLLPLRLAPADAAPRRVNLLVESVDPRRSGGDARLHLARRLAERGMRVRFVTVDPVAALPRGWASDLAGAEVAFGAETPGLEVSREDAFVATGWRTAHLAPGRFLYLIEDYEPLRHPAGTLAALAAESYTLPHFALFSSELLRGYFRRRGLGVHDDDASATFEEAVTIAAPERTTFAGRLLFDAGDLFELGVLGLARALERGAFAGWTLECTGSGRSGRLDLGGGDWMRLLPGGPLGPGYDVGLAAVAGPHPGRAPLEMARTGMLAVTTTYEGKDARALAAISGNLVAAEPTVEGVAGALERAAAAAGDLERRLQGSALRWSTDWDASFGDELLDRVTGFLRP
jgi:glycosyltransferase involved in cell wall biosynthesis